MKKIIEKSIEKKKAQIEKLNKDILELQKDLEREKLSKDFQSFKLGEKEIRIYKWENKLFKDFPMPEGFDWAEQSDFIELVYSGNFEAEKYPIYYYMKNPFKLNKAWVLAGAYLNWDGNWGSVDSYLGDSDGSGRVVVRSIK